MKNPNLEKLRRLQLKIDAIRKELNISSPGTVLFQNRNWDDSLILVEADGFGGATTSIVEGNYPIDYFTRFEKPFGSETEAEQIAEELATWKSLAADILNGTA